MSSTAPYRFNITERAIRQIATIMANRKAEPGQPFSLRVSVLSGGCNGFQYRFEITTTVAQDDTVIPAGEHNVIIDPISLELLDQAELDYKDSLMGAHFIINNPNASSSCGCGNSFSLAS